MRWDDVNARARGLATHLLGRDALLRASRAGSWSAAAAVAIGSGFPAEAGAAGSQAELDRAIGRVVARRLLLLDRWLGSRRPALALIFEDEERRALRSLLRGAAAGTAPVVRRRALTPTPGLPDRVVDRLAEAKSPAELVRGLLRAGHPAGRALAAARTLGETGPGSGLFRLELALARLYATRAVRGARRAGRLVRRFAALAVDRENAAALLLAPSWATDVEPEEVYLPGGRALAAEEFAAIARLADPAVAGARLADRFRGTPLAPAFATEPAPVAFEARALAATLAWYRRLGRSDPLGPGVFFSVVERIRGEAHDLRAVIGGLALGVPLDQTERLLVTAA